MADGRRVRLLCEDRRTDRFLRGLCKRFDVWVLESDVAPGGRGDASLWVRKRYAACVKLLRAHRHQRNLGLLVAIDGDNKGIHARKAELAAELTSAGVPQREGHEAIALFVPTWSVETWLALLGRGGLVAETESLKDHGDFRHLWEDGKSEATTIAGAVRAWNGEVQPCASLADAYVEADRVGL